jgi:hypothetical protein
MKLYVPAIVDRGIAESLADFAVGRSFGPFKTDKELIESLHRESARARSKTKAKRRPRCTIFRAPK